MRRPRLPTAPPSVPPSKSTGGEVRARPHAGAFFSLSRGLYGRGPGGLFDTHPHTCYNAASRTTSRATPEEREFDEPAL
jgi:hypothetical protein